MNTITKNVPLFAIVGLLVLLGASWMFTQGRDGSTGKYQNNTSESQSESEMEMSASSEHGAAMMMRVGDIATSTLSAVERADLLFVFEEEKLARDVYAELGKTWSWRTIGHVSRSESMHMSATGGLLESYGIPEPAVTPTAGKYADKEIQALYDRLVAQGLPSAEVAIKVGLFIEEFDIQDLKTRMARTDNADILAVYDYLLQGSYMHLHHFSMRLSEVGGTYTPQVLSQTEFDTAMGSTGGGMMMGGGKGGGMRH